MDQFGISGGFWEKGHSHLLANTFSWGPIGYSLLRLGVKQRLEKSHLIGVEVMTYDCWEIGSKPLAFTQNPLGLKPVGDGHKTLFQTFLEGDEKKNASASEGRNPLVPRTQAKTHCCWGKGGTEDTSPLKEVQKTVLGPRNLHQYLGRGLLLLGEE